MKRQIRKGVFETNSSSVHSIVINNDGMEEPKLKHRKIKENTVGKDIYNDYIVVDLAEYGRARCEYNSQDDKLSYLVTLAFVLCHEDLNELEDDYCYREMVNQILEYVHKFDKYKSCLGIHINQRTLKDASIDHQSLEDYWSIGDFESVMKVDYITFIFNKYITLKTDSD